MKKELRQCAVEKLVHYILGSFEGYFKDVFVKTGIFRQLPTLLLFTTVTTPAVTVTATIIFRNILTPKPKTNVFVLLTNQSG